MEHLAQEYYEAVFDTDRKRALELVRNAVKNGVLPEDIVFKVVVPSIDLMVQSFSETFDASIAQHFVASQIASEVTDEMLSQFKVPPTIAGKVVIGTSCGDFHGLGKKIVMGCLKAQMIDVVDLGLNVGAEQFVDAAVKNNAQVIGIASMMVHTARGENGCLKVRQLLRQKKLENQIKVIVGGAPYRFDPELYRTVQADAWAANGIKAGHVIIGLIKAVKPS